MFLFYLLYQTAALNRQFLPRKKHGVLCCKFLKKKKKKMHVIGMAKKFIQVFLRCSRKTQTKFSAKPVLAALSSNSVDEMWGRRCSLRHMKKTLHHVVIFILEPLSCGPETRGIISFSFFLLHGARSLLLIQRWEGQALPISELKS